MQGVAPTTAAPRTPPRPPDAEQLRFGGVVESPRRDVFVRTDRKIARNNSSATVTDTEEFSWTVSRSVTVEHQRAAVHGTTATLTLPVLLSLGQTLQRELRSTYALATEATLTRTKTVSVEIPPHSSIELELTWKIVRQPGFGRFTDTGGLKVDLPYEVDMEIELDWRTNDIAGPS
ncbi:hypothetical protein [Streptomyces sp. NPDC048603]|uniref:hypothetical protein n=1 Tax=Streptomyces sp. NPDC048603 TaxID=3365577 RepID=UPI003710907D